jgi:hypothetical protein
MFSRKLLPILLILSMTLPFGMLLAQESTEEPTLTVTDPAPEPTVIVITPDPVETPPPVEEPPEETPVTEPQELLGLIFSLLKDSTFIVWAAAGVVIFVSLLKMLAQAVGITITGNNAIFLTIVVQVIVWIGYAIANFFSQGEAFKQGYLIVVDIARSLFPLFGSIFAGHVLYTQALKRGVPVLGYKPQAKPH